MSLNYRTEEYYKRFIELQEKLRNSEEERLKLEMKFNEMVRVTKEETQAHYRKLRTQYKRFLEEDRRRQDRNERILRSLDRMDSRLAILRAKTERFQLLRQQYHYFLDRIYKLNQTKIEPSKINRSEIKIDPPYTASKSESYSKPPIITEQVIAHKNPAYSQSSDLLIDHYIQNLSSERIRDLLRKEETARSQPSFSLLSDQNIYSYGSKPSYNGEDLYNVGEGEFKPNYANSVADDIMNSIYSRPRPKLNEEVGKAPIFNENTSNLTKMSHSEINDNYSKKKSSQEDSDMDNEWSEAESVKAVNLPAAKSLDVVDDGEVIQPSSPPKISTPQNIEKEPSTPLFVSEEPPSESKLQTKDETIENIPKGMEITGEETELIADATEKLTIHDEQPQEIVSIKEKLSREILETEEIYEQKLPSPEPINNHELEQVDKKVDDSPAKEIPQPSTVSEETQQVLNTTELESQPIAEQKDQQYEETINPQEYYDESGQMYDETGQPILTSYDQYQQQPQYDESGQLIQQYQYDEQGQVIQLDENGQPIIQQYDETGYNQSYPQYDENGQLVQQYDESGQPIQQYYPEQQQQYDENGQPIQQYDKNGQPIQEYYGNYEQQYDDSGQLIQQCDYSDQQYAAQDYPAEEVAHKELELSEKEIPDETQPVGKPEEPIQVATTENVDEEVDLSVESNKKEEDEEMEKSVEGKNAPNVMEMLDTDTESAKQDTKISNDSDFDFSNG